MRCANPVYRTLDFAGIKAGTALCFRVVGTVDFRDFAVPVRHIVRAGHKICIHQADFIARIKSEIFLWRIYHKIVPLNKKFP